VTYPEFAVADGELASKPTTGKPTDIAPFSSVVFKPPPSRGPPAIKMRLHQEPLPLKPEGGDAGRPYTGQGWIKVLVSRVNDVSNGLIDLHA
jgi:hypothetical protein